MNVEKELEKLLTEGRLEQQDKQLEAVKRLPPRWIAVYPSSFHQVEEVTKRLLRFIKKEDLDGEVANSKHDRN